MLRAAAQFQLDAVKGLSPRWLSFCGPSGIGKTHLATMLFEHIAPMFRSHPTLLNGAIKHVWARLLPRLRDGDYWLLNDIRDANLYLLDDFGTEKPTDFALEKLYEIVEARNRKWTIFTCNLSVAQIADTIDTRISSRMVRNNSVVVDVDAPDFSLRPKSCQKRA